MRFGERSVDYAQEFSQRIRIRVALHGGKSEHGHARKRRRLLRQTDADASESVVRARERSMPGRPSRAEPAGIANLRNLPARVRDGRGPSPAVGDGFCGAFGRLRSRVRRSFGWRRDAGARPRRGGADVFPETSRRTQDRGGWRRGSSAHGDCPRQRGVHPGGACFAKGASYRKNESPRDCADEPCGSGASGVSSRDTGQGR